MRGELALAARLLDDQGRDAPDSPHWTARLSITRATVQLERGDAVRARETLRSVEELTAPVREWPYAVIVTARTHIAMDPLAGIEDVDRLLRDGADKVSVNTSAVARPELISEISRHFGNQVLVLSLDARRAQGSTTASGFEVTTRGGREGTGRCAIDWIREAAERGVGEILLNSIDADGTREGFDLELIAAARAAVDVPLIASGGAGRVDHFAPAVAAGADALLAASVFHFGTLSIIEVKDALRAEGIEVR